MNKLKAEITLTEKTGDFVYCGKKVIQDKDGIKVTQHDAAMAIQYAGHRAPTTETTFPHAQY